MTQPQNDEFEDYINFRFNLAQVKVHLNLIKKKAQTQSKNGEVKFDALAFPTVIAAKHKSQRVG